MKEYIYLVKNGSLYNLGLTKDLSRTKKDLLPGSVVLTFESTDGNKIIKKLQEKYKNKIVPQSDYYRLEENDIASIKNYFGKDSIISYDLPFFRGFKLFLLVLVSWLFISLTIINLIFSPIFERLDFK